MRKSFESYFPPGKKFFEDLWKDSLIILDANVLLDMYRYSEKTRGEFISVLEKYRDKLWLPYQVAFEFAKNRPTVILTQVDIYQKAKSQLAILKESSQKEINKIFDFRSHPLLERDEFNTVIKKALAGIEEKLDYYVKVHPNYLDNDPILDSLLDIFEGRVGPKYNNERLQMIFKEGEDRYRKEIPPGYADARGPNKKDGDAIYGDLILWFQIIDKVKEIEVPGIIFLSNEEKKDWLWESRGRTLGCRPELREEMYKETNALFYMYKTERFLHFASKRVDVVVTPESIKEVKSFEEEDRKDRKRQMGSSINSWAKNLLAEHKLKDKFFAQLENQTNYNLSEKLQARAEEINHILSQDSKYSDAILRAFEQASRQEEQDRKLFFQDSKYSDAILRAFEQASRQEELLARSKKFAGGSRFRENTTEDPKKISMSQQEDNVKTRQEAEKKHPDTDEGDA